MSLLSLQVQWLMKILKDDSIHMLFLGSMSFIILLDLLHYCLAACTAILLGGGVAIE